MSGIATTAPECLETFGSLLGAGFQLAGLCYSERDFAETVGQAFIESRADLTSVEISTGIDEFGRVAFYIRNREPDAPHMVISTPFTPMQWLDAVEA